MILKEKAYIINNVNWSEPWFTPDEIFYAESYGKAKQKVLNMIKYDDYTDNIGNVITYLTLRMVRSKENDKYLTINNDIKTLSQINQANEISERNNYYSQLITENPNAKVYIKKRGSYYCEGKCGYTEQISNAGVYTIQDAIKEVCGCDIGDNMSVVLIDETEHNNLINNKIEELKGKLI